LGAHVPAAWWVKNAYQFKEHIAAMNKSPRIIIMGGSNALFGVDSSVVQEITGYPVINLSGHAGLDLNFYYFKLEELIGKEDIVIMPLEDTYYEQGNFTDWFVNNMLAWGQDDYLNHLNIVEMIKFILSVPVKRIREGMMKQKGTNPVIPKDTVIKTMDNLLSSEGAQWRGYSYTSMNRHGDFISGEKVKNKLLKESKDGFKYFQWHALSPSFLSSYLRIDRLVQQNGGRLVLTWPVSMRNKLFDLSKPEYWRIVAEKQTALQRQSIKIECNPALFHYNVKFFFDTQYHLNKHGTMIRSENLARCLKNILEGEGQDQFSYNEASQMVLKQEEYYRRNIIPEN
jgi:hypothetical protein